MAEVRRFGFTLLSSGESTTELGGPSVNIIFVHGLGGHPRKTWEAVDISRNPDAERFSAAKGSTKLKSAVSHLNPFRAKQVKCKERREMADENRDSEDEQISNDADQKTVFWPKDLLPISIPTARIHTYGYDADAISDFFDGKGRSKNTISQHAQDVLNKLEREFRDEQPIIFVAHSLGGIVVKDALRRAKFSNKESSNSIYQRARCILFLGTPHRGSDLAEKGGTLTKIAALSLKDSNQKIVSSLEVDSEVLSIIHSGFMTILNSHQIFIHSFQEGQGISSFTPASHKVVSDFSSMFDEHPMQTVETINANHMEMTKFPNLNDEGYRQVSSALLDYIEKIQNKDGGSGNPDQQECPHLAISIPFSRNPRFVGRAEYLADLSQEFSSTAQHVRLAMVGKSQIALEFAYGFKEMSPKKSIFWIDARDSFRLEESCRNAAKKLRLPGSAELESDPVQLLCEWLKSDESSYWLLVIDNADDTDLFFGQTMEAERRVPSRIGKDRPPLAHLIHQPGGAVLFITKDRRAGLKLTGNGQIMTVNKMTNAESEVLLRNKLQDERIATEEIAQLLEAVDNLPQAIAQAAAFIRENCISVSDYLRLYYSHGRDREELLNHDFKDLGREWDAANAVMSTCLVIFDEIKKQTFVADLLLLISCFDRQAIPKSLLMQQGHGSLAITKAVGTLISFFILMPNEDNTVFSVHRLVHFCMGRWRMAHDKGKSWANRALELLSTCFPSGEQEDWMLCSKLSPHVEAARAQFFQENVETSAKLFYNCAWYLWNAGRLVASASYAKDALRLRNWGVDTKDLETLDSISLLATILRHQGLYSESEMKARDAMRGYELMCEPKDPLILKAIGNLALVLQTQGQYHEVEKMTSKALTTFEEELGRNNSDVLTTKMTLASSLLKQERYQEAEGHIEQALAGYREALGDKHPHTLISAGTMVHILIKRKTYESAEALSRETLEGFKSLVGEKHPNTVTSLLNLATVLRHQEKYLEAEQTCCEALTTYEEVLGRNHPSYFTALSVLAAIAQGQGDVVRAQKLHTDALDGRRRTLGEQHRDKKQSLENLNSII